MAHRKRKRPRICRRQWRGVQLYENAPVYYMEVAYNGKNYTMEVEKFVYDKYYSNSDDIVLYYDAQGDDVFVAGTGVGNIVATILIGGVGVVIVVIILICMLIKNIRKKKK